MANQALISPPRLWAGENDNLAEPGCCAVIGRLDPTALSREFNKNTYYQPRQSLPPAENRILPFTAPPALRTLYDVAASDMRKNGFDPDQLHVYMLYHEGTVAPEKSLREGFWHFDLTRLLRAPDAPAGKVPVAIEYATTNVLPTVFTSRLLPGEGGTLPLRTTIENRGDYDRLGDAATAAGLVFGAEAGDIVRYDSVLLHRGPINEGTRPVDRVFLHIAFSPVP